MILRPAVRSWIVLALCTALTVGIVGGVAAFHLDRQRGGWAHHATVRQAVALERAQAALERLMALHRLAPEGTPVSELREALVRLGQAARDLEDEAAFIALRPDVSITLSELREAIQATESLISTRNRPTPLVDQAARYAADMRPMVLKTVGEAFAIGAAPEDISILSAALTYGGLAVSLVAGVALFGMLRASAAEREDLRRRLADKQRMESLGRAASGIAHDFNNILMTIRGTVDLLKGGLAPGSRQAELVSSLQNAAERGSEVAGQILRFARALPLKPKPEDLAPLVADMAALLRPSLPAQISLDVDANTGNVAEIDRGEIGRVILNLLVNAQDALQGRMRARIAIRVGAVDVPPGQFGPLDEGNPLQVGEECRLYLGQISGPAVCVAVEDDGPGIDPILLPNLFEPFFTTKNAGSGMGLASCLGVVRAHRGVISVVSTPGRGARFEVYLPRSVEQAARGVQPAWDTPRAPFGAGRTILVVDDDMIVGITVARLLETYGFEVVLVSSMAEALTLLEDGPAMFHLVITDFDMPGGNGLDLARRVRAMPGGHALPMVLLSGFLNEDVQREAGALRLFPRTKPINGRDLAAAVREALGERIPA